MQFSIKAAKKYKIREDHPSVLCIKISKEQFNINKWETCTMQKKTISVCKFMVFKNWGLDLYFSRFSSVCSSSPFFSQRDTSRPEIDYPLFMIPHHTRRCIYIPNHNIVELGNNTIRNKHCNVMEVIKTVVVIVVEET